MNTVDFDCVKAARVQRYRFKNFPLRFNRQQRIAVYGDDVIVG